MNYDKILFIGIMISLASLMSATAWAQNITTTTASNTKQLEEIANNTPIASDSDLDQTKTLFGGTAAAIGSGLVAEFVARRKKNKRIDNALRGTDYDLMDVIKTNRMFFVAAKKPENKGKTVDEILDLPAYPNNDLSKTTIGQAIDKEYFEYANWFKERYQDNPE